jgi:hypothetical protein
VFIDAENKFKNEIYIYILSIFIIFVVGSIIDLGVLIALCGRKLPNDINRQ